MENAYKELIEQIRGKTVDHLLANHSDESNGFDIVFSDGTSLELYVVEGKFRWVFDGKLNID